MTVTRLSPGGYDIRAELLGGRDHLVVGWSERTPVRSVERNARPVAADRWTSWQTRFAEAYRAELADFLGVASGGTSSGATVRDAVEAQRIAEAAHQSLEGGSRVTLER